MEILIKDGVRYKLKIPIEDELELAVKKCQKDIFGENSLYFDVKKKIATVIEEEAIPDGYLINFENGQFYIVEIELSSHPDWHIGSQINKFANALKNFSTLKHIADIMKDYVEEDVIRKKFVKDRIRKRELYEFFIDILAKVGEQKFQIVVVVEGDAKKVEEVWRGYSPKPKIIEFKTFVRESGEKELIYSFSPLFELPEKKIIELIARKGKFKALFDTVTKEVIIGSKRYFPSGAAKKVAHYNIDGWYFWKFCDSKTGKLLFIDEYRKRPQKSFVKTQFKKTDLQKITAGEFEYEGNGIFVFKKDPDVKIDAAKTTKEVITVLRDAGYFVTRPSSFYHQIREKSGLLKYREQKR